MLTVGVAPFLECSTRGDQRFSPFYARVNGVSIEDAYHAKKILRPTVPVLLGPEKRTGLGWREAKELQKAGWRMTNPKSCARLYARMWDQYIMENRHLLKVLKNATGLSDMFGKASGNVCQVTELWRIRSLYLNGQF